jgi:hypothetical protein
VRVGTKLPPGIGQANAIEHVHRPLISLAPIGQPVRDEDASQLGTDRDVGVQCLHRVLEHDPDFFRSQFVQSAVIGTDDFRAIDRDTALERSRRRQKTEDRECRLCLPGTRLADQPEGLARLDTE